METSNIGNSQSAGVALRGYQVDAVTAALKSLKAGSRNMVVMPTGAGKSLVISEITKKKPNQQILIITPRIRLLKQLLPILGDHGVLSAGMGAALGYDHDIIAGTFQTMLRRRDLKPPAVIIIDECHLLPPKADTLK